jgi:hypothetical protein
VSSQFVVGKVKIQQDKFVFGFVVEGFAVIDVKLTGHLKSKPGYACKSWLERVVIMGYDKGSPKSVKIVSPMSGEENLKTTWESVNKQLIIRRPGVNICSDWELNINP